MFRLSSLLCFFIVAITYAQPPAMELTPHGFDPVEVTIQNTSNEKLIELSKAWAASVNIKLKGYDASNVTSNSMVISAFRRNAFFIRNNGESFNYNITYSIKLSFHGNYYTLHFLVDDIYTDDDTLIKYKIPDYFDTDGDIKEGYENMKPSLERSANDLIQSYHNYIVNYR
ncbi:hypothetical protein ACX0HA_01025 [Flavobacterium hauense]